MGKSYEVWSLPKRPAQGQHHWRMGVRQGPSANGALHSRLKAQRPGLRHAGLREILRVLANPGQVGNPASMKTDARLRFAAMG